MPRTRTAGFDSGAAPGAAEWAPSCARTASKIGWRGLYTPAAVLLTLSALARLLAVVFSRTDCAAMPDPAMSKALNDDMTSYPSLVTENGGQQTAEFGVEESERRLVTHGVLGERGLLDLRVDGVAIERGREWRAVLEIGVRSRVGRCGTANVAGL